LGGDFGSWKIPGEKGVESNFLRGRAIILGSGGFGHSREKEVRSFKEWGSKKGEKCEEGR